MTVKVLDNGSAGALVLLIPLAFGFVVLYSLWPLLLLIAAMIVAFKLWQDYRWQKWCEEINPYFNQVIKENKGYVTPIDLSVKGNLTANAAKTFLARKSDEYGTSPQKVAEQGMVYYFPTASALGSILDDSEPEPVVNSYQLAGKDSNKLSVRGIAQLAKQEQNEADDTATDPESSSVALITRAESPHPTAISPESETDSSTINQTTSVDAGQSLIQAELAKRLDLNSSTVGRRKSDPDFPLWSMSKDPEGIAWRYDPDTKLYVVDVSD